jgi:hypothetical protein
MISIIGIPDVNTNVLLANILAAIQEVSMSNINVQLDGIPDVNENVLLYNIWLAITNGGGGGFSPEVFQAYLATLPTSDPHVLNEPWNNGGFMCISLG